MKTKIRLSFILVAISAGLLMLSCKTSQNSMKTENISGTWILKTLDGQPITNLFKGKVPSMTIDLAANRINGNGGCNSYNGGFTFDKGIFTAPNVASTMMMCPQENKEHQFFQMLAKPNTVSVVNGVLTFSNAGKTVAEFARGIDQGLLTGTWVLKSIEGENLSSLFTIAEKVATLEFKAGEGRIAGNAGCNGYGATYTVAGSAITVGPVMSTKMACPNLDGENKFVQAITGTSTLSVSQNELVFLKDGKATLKFGKK